VGFLRNFGSKISLITLTKCHKHSNVVFSPILQYSLQSSTTWLYASMCIFGWSSIWQHHMHISFVQNKCRVHICYPWCRRTMCDAFDINDEKVDRCRSNVLQNNFTQFNYGWLHALELHLGYNLGEIPHVVFLPVVANLLLTTSKHQTQDQLQLLVLGQSHQTIFVIIMPFCSNHEMIKKDKNHKNKWSGTKYIIIKSCEDFASMCFNRK